MQPLRHPSIEEVTVEAILHALSDPTRAAIFLQITSQNSSHNCSNFLNIRDTPIPKSTLSQHFRVLREAGLIRGERQGVEMRNVSRFQEINEHFPGLIPGIMMSYKAQSDRKAGTKEAAPLDSPL
jgi:DNA-binding transcriptional ArsR family regulator